MNPDDFKQMNSDDLVRLYKRQKIDKLLNELEDMREECIEQALKLSDFRDAREVLDYIRKKY
jgi:DNA transposition AAA+ family ATPase